MTGRTGINPSDEMIKTHQEMRMGKTMRWATFKVTEDWKEVIVDKRGRRESKWEEFVGELEAAGDCRYGAFSMDFENSEKQQRNKLITVLWTPSCATVKSKMLYAATKESVKRAFVGVGLEIQASSSSSLDFVDILASLQRLR